MTILSDQSLNNILNATVAPYWAMDTKPEGRAAVMYARAPKIMKMKSSGLIQTSDTFKTGVNFHSQTIGDATMGTDLSISANVEYLQMPTSVSYDFFSMNKCIGIPRNQIALIEKAYGALMSQKQSSKSLKAKLRENVDFLFDDYIDEHIRQMLYNLEQNHWDHSLLTGSTSKSIMDILDPDNGPSTDFEGEDLTELKVDMNQPLYVKESGGTGATGLGYTLTGTTIDHATALQWITAICNVQKQRGAMYDEIWMNLVDYGFFAHLAENQVTWNANWNESLPRPTMIPQKGDRGGINLQSHASTFTINGIPVYCSAVVESGHIWLLRSGAFRMEAFDNKYENARFYGKDSKVGKEKALFRMYFERLPSSHGRLSGDAQVFVNLCAQFRPTDFSGFASVSFDETTTT